MALASQSNPLAPRWERLARLGASDRLRSGAVLVLYLLISILLVGRQMLADPSHICACSGSTDAAAYMWSLVWWPHALVHGLDPFVSHVIWVPDGANLASAATLPAASLLISPLTAAAGPVAAYNLLSVLSPVLAAWFAFRLCRYLCGRWLPSVAGGYLFGFSSYELVQLTSHLNLVLTFLVPAAAHLVLLRLDGRISARRLVVLLTVVLVLLLGTSEEILVTFLAFGAVALLLGYCFGSAAKRTAIVALVPTILLAGAATCVIAAPFLYYALTGLGPNPTASWTEVANRVSTDPLNYLLPTPLTWLGHGLDASLATKFNEGNFSEGVAYLGIPVVAILALFLIPRRREPGARILLGLLVVTVVASLGPHLHIASPPRPMAGTFVYRPSIPLPWLPVSHLPLFKQVAPARIAMYVSLIAAVVVALWLAAPGKRRWPRWLLVVAGVVLLLPDVSPPYWHARMDDPRFFTDSTYRRYMFPGERALIFPFGHNGNSMLWQAQTGMYFQMTEGYVGVATPPSYYNEAIDRDMQFGGTSQLPLSQVGPQLKDFIRRRKVDVIIVEASGLTAWSLLVPATLHLRARKVDGVEIYDIPPSWRQ